MSQPRRSFTEDSAVSTCNTDQHEHEHNQSKLIPSVCRHQGSRLTAHASKQVSRQDYRLGRALQITSQTSQLDVIRITRKKKKKGSNRAGTASAENRQC